MSGKTFQQEYHVRGSTIVLYLLSYIVIEGTELNFSGLSLQSTLKTLPHMIEFREDILGE